MEEIAPEKKHRRLGIYQIITSLLAIPSFFLVFFGAGVQPARMHALAHPNAREGNIGPILGWYATGAVLGLAVFTLLLVTAAILAAKFWRERPRPKGLWRIGFFLYWLNWLAIVYFVGYACMWLSPIR